jgi:single-stranded-DNA-specific exonuclease
MNKPRWTWDVRPVDRERAAQVAADLNVPPVVAQVLHARGIDDRADAVRFLHPALTDLPEPYSLLGLPAAVARLEQAIKADE